MGTCIIVFFHLLGLSFISAYARDPLKWPFAQDSIWNMPIGDEAVYIPAGIQQRERKGMTIDEDVIVLRPEAPLTSIYYSPVGWSDGPSRCTNFNSNQELVQVPIPDDFVVSPENWDGRTPNSGLAVLMPDGETIRQTQPFARCTAGQAGTSKVINSFPPQSIFGDGIRGAHGGSGLSAIGGTLRFGELVPGGVIRHALKVNLYGRRNLYFGDNEPDEKSGFRWPAVKADSGFDNPSSNNYYGGSNQALQMGSLVALHNTEDLSSLSSNSLGLETEAALILARAFQDYGAYVVDNTAWDVYAIVTEWGPDGRVNDEVEQKFGHAIKQDSRDAPFSKDMDRIFLNLFVIDNNGPTRIGGGGTPRVPLAPAFGGPPILQWVRINSRMEEATGYMNRRGISNGSGGWDPGYDTILIEFNSNKESWHSLQWAFEDAGNGKYRIKSRWGNTNNDAGYLTRNGVFNGVDWDPANDLKLNTLHMSWTSQLWMIETADEGWVRLVNVWESETGYLTRVAINNGSGWEPQNSVKFTGKHGGWSQQWRTPTV